jgi:hypothetical protein
MPHEQGILFQNRTANSTTMIRRSWLLILSLSRSLSISPEEGIRCSTILFLYLCPSIYSLSLSREKNTFEALMKKKSSAACLYLCLISLGERSISNSQEEEIDRSTAFLSLALGSI